MYEVEITARREYEMFVKAEVAKMAVSNKYKAVIRQLIMKGFDDGIKMTQHNLKVLVMEHD